MGKLLWEAREKRQEIIKLDGAKASMTDIKLACESGSFFGQEKLVLIENFLGRSKSTEKDAIVAYLGTNCPLKDVVFWESKQISQTNLKKLSKSLAVKLFKLPPLVFKFLDCLSPGNAKVCLAFLKDLRYQPPELIFYFLCQRFYQLIIAKDLGPKGLTRQAPWQQAKLATQAKKFTLAQLENIYARLLQIDTQVKTGQSPMPLAWHLDLFLAQL